MIELVKPKLEAMYFCLKKPKRPKCSPRNHHPQFRVLEPIRCNNSMNHPNSRKVVQQLQPTSHNPSVLLNPYTIGPSQLDVDPPPPMTSNDYSWPHTAFNRDTSPNSLQPHVKFKYFKHEGMGPKCGLTINFTLLF